MTQWINQSLSSNNFHNPTNGVQKGEVIAMSYLLIMLLLFFLPFSLLYRIVLVVVAATIFSKLTFLNSKSNGRFKETANL